MNEAADSTAPMTSEDVREQDGAYRIAGTRISLDSLVYAYLDGQTAEAIAQAFPLLTLEQVYGALAYDLAHRQAIDAYLEQGSREFQCLRQAARDSDPMWYHRLAEARRTAA